MNLWFTADLHFFHKKMARLRYFSDLPAEEPMTLAHAEHMNNAMVLEWNSYVAPDDLVYILGDVSFGNPKKTSALFDLLNGRKYLILGNHDHEKMLNALALQLDGARDYLMSKHQEQLIAMSHYPMLTWDRAHHGSWMLHGHSPGNLKAETTTRLDVGWDVHKRPISFEEVAQIMESRKYFVVDQHEE